MPTQDPRFTRIVRWMPACSLALASFALPACVVDQHPGVSTGGVTTTGKLFPDKKGKDKGPDATATAPDTTMPGPDSTMPGPSSTAPGANTSAPQGPPDQRPCSDQEDAVCVRAIPPQWQGPVQPQVTEDPSKLLPCAAGDKVVDGTSLVMPNANENIFATQLIAPPAAGNCQGCEAQVNAGFCEKPLYMVRYFSPDAEQPCGEINKNFAPFPIPVNCHWLEPEWMRDAPNSAISATPPKPTQKKTTCGFRVEPTTKLQPPAFPGYHRICLGQATPGQCEVGQTCTDFEQRLSAPKIPQVCIFREGIHSCPQGAFSAHKQVLYGAVNDNRGCKGCEMTEKSSDITCPNLLSLETNDGSILCKEGQTVTTEELCVSAKQLTEDGPVTVRYAQDMVPQHQGSCTTTPWEPTGQIELAEPITLCCGQM